MLALGNKASVTLRLPILQSGLPRNGYIVKRSGPGGNQTLVVRPVNKVEAAGKYGIASKDYDLTMGAMQALGDSKTTAEQRGFLLLNLLSTVSNPKLARAVGLLFEDTSLAPGNYTYSVSAQNQVGSVTATVGKDVPLAAPTSLKAVPPAQSRPDVGTRRRQRSGLPGAAGLRHQ